jgi:hypothetical protein
VFDLVGPHGDLSERGTAGAVRGDRDAPAGERIQQIPLGLERQSRPRGGCALPGGAALLVIRGVADRRSVAEESEWAVGRDGGIELPEGAGRGVPRIREDRVAFRCAGLVHLLEAVERHVDLASHLDDPRRRRPFLAEAKRDVANRAEIGRDVFPNRPVATGGARDKHAVAIGQADRSAVDLELGRVPGPVERIASEPFDALVPCGDFLVGEGVAER